MSSVNSNTMIHNLYILVFLLMGILLASCGSSSEKKDTPITGFSSCIAVDLPPITLTPSRTSAEKQLIGDNIEIEKNGWLIASSRSVYGRNQAVAQSSAETTGGEELRQYYREMSVLDFYGDMVDQYKRDGLMGESSDGVLLFVPESISPRKGRYRNPGEIKNATRVLNEVNRSRQSVFQYLQKRGEGSDFKLKEIRNAEKGDWIHEGSGGWRVIK